MKQNEQGTAPADAQSPWRGIRYAVVGLLLLGCCAWSGLGAWFFAPLTAFMADRLSYVHGKAEVIAPAQSHPGGILSPDGRRMLMGWSKDGKRESFVWDLLTDERHPLTTPFSSMCWLNPNLIGALDSASHTYYLIDGRNASAVKATLIIVEEQFGERDGAARLQERWRAADELYLVEDLTYTGYTVFSLEQAQPYVYFDFSPSHNVIGLLKDIPYVHIPHYCNIAPEGVRVYSPDGRFYTKLSIGENAHVLIYSREGKLVAEAAKTGWDPRLMGWAYDSSGVYFQMLISGGGASVLVPYEPIFKLSPLTEEEARWAPVWTGLKWAGGLAVVATGGWLWRRWRRAK